MHLFNIEKNFFGGWGIVGAQIPVGAGLAFAQAYRNTDGVTLCYFGEGSIHQGAFHEAMNMAAMWKLPVIYICENNNWAMGTPIERQTNVHDVHRKANAYDVPNAKVDGQDLRAVYAATSEAVARARAGEGPTLLEMKTYRFRGHSMSDPATYRTREEVQEEMQRDPLIRVRQWLVEEGTTTEDALAELDKTIKATVKDSIDFASESPFPGNDAIFKNVLVED